jgi:predicted nucleic acid-binding protein
MPGKHRVNAEQCVLFIGDIRQRLTIVALDDKGYQAMLEEFSPKGIVGGAVYDALLATCALKSRARTLYSWNLRHYGQFGTEVTRILKTP